MSDFKKAFQKLEKETMSEAKKQMVFDRIIEEQQRSKTRKKVFSMAAAAMAFMIVAAVFLAPGILVPSNQGDEIVILPQPSQKVLEEELNLGTGPQVVSTVMLSLNPVVKLGLDKDGQVVEAVGMDQDGEKLLRGVDCTGLSFENAAIVVVNQLLLNDYITSDVEQEEITVSVESDQMDIEQLEVVTETIKTAAEQHKINVNVTESEETKQVSIVLTAEEDSLPEPDSSQENKGLLTVEFVLDEENPSVVNSVKVFTEDNEGLITDTEFEGMPYKEAVLKGINRLIEKGLINDNVEDRTILKLSIQDETKIANLKYLTQMMVDQAGLSLEVMASDELGSFELKTSDNRPQEQPVYTMSQILDPAVHKNKDELTKTQLDILELVYTGEQIDELLTIRYWVVAPNLVGMEEEKAVAMLQQMGIVPVVTIEYNDQYAEEFSEGTVYFQDVSASEVIEKGARLRIHVLGDNPNPLGEGWTQSVYSEITTSEEAGFDTEYEIYNSGTKQLYTIVTNLSEENVLEYDTDFVLERLYDSEWYSAVCTECFEPIKKTLEPKESVGEKIDLSFAASLEDGHYRIVKQIGGQVLSTEFDIQEGGYDRSRMCGYLPLNELPKEYTLELAKANGDMGFDGETNEVYNEDKLVSFLEKVSKKIPCMVRKVEFAEEGYAIIEDVVFNGEHFVVKRDTSRTENGADGVVTIRYSYMTLGYNEGKTNIIVTNSYERLPFEKQYNNTDRYELLSDTAVVESIDLESIVEGMMDEQAPLKVYSTDGQKYVSYTDGNKTVNYEVDIPDIHFASGIIFPDDIEVIEMVALEWRDDSVVVITYKTVEEQYDKKAYDVLKDGYTELTEDEQAGIETIQADYFTDADRADMLQQFAPTEFLLTLTGAEGTKTYRASTLEASVEGTPEPVLVVDWSEEKWNAFAAEILGTGMYDWNRVYKGTEHAGEWTLRLLGQHQAVVSSGSGNVPEGFSQLMNIVKEYFGQ